MIVEFSSGAEISFGASSITIGQEEMKKMKLHKMKDVISYLYKKYGGCRNTLFKGDFTLAPGILCCIDDVDWQILDCENASVEFGSRVLFLSTMHGG